jgi:hypothetical protein
MRPARCAIRGLNARRAFQLKRIRGTRQGSKDIRRLARRALILAAALVTLAVPVFHVTRTPGFSVIPTASACSNVSCVITATNSAQIETFVSPITVTSPAFEFPVERATSAQVMGPLSLTGTVGFTVYDLRGNNQGWVASLTTSGFTNSLFPLSAIPASAFTVRGTPSVTTTCLGPMACGKGLGVASTTDLSTVPNVAVECPLEAIGEGVYAVTVPLNLTIPNGPPGFTAEKVASYPGSWLGTFTVGVMEGQPLSSFTAFGCPPFSTMVPPTSPVVPMATVTPTATATPTATVTPTARRGG